MAFPRKPDVIDGGVCPDAAHHILKLAAIRIVKQHVVRDHRAHAKADGEIRQIVQPQLVARPAAQGRACGVAVVGVAEGALPTLADVIVAPEPAQLAEAAANLTRRELPLPGRIELAEEVVSLYRELGAKG